MLLSFFSPSCLHTAVERELVLQKCFCTLEIKGNEKDRQKNKLSLVVCMDRSALVLLVSKPLQEEIISPIIDIDNCVSDTSGKKS